MIFGTCSYCPAVGPLQDDHPTLRDDRGEPNDADFVLPACASCNKTRWHAFRLASQGRFDVHPVARRQAAAAFFFRSWADRGEDLTLSVVQQRAVARILVDGATAIVALISFVAALVWMLWAMR